MRIGPYTKVLPFFFFVQHKKETYTGLKRDEGE